MNPTVATAVDRLHFEATAITSSLQRVAETSLQNAASDNFRKALLLAAASYFEHRICSLLFEFVEERSGGPFLVASFVRNKAISRQYHTLFDWESANANKFFGLFGEEFRAAMSQKLQKSDALLESVKAFLEIGRDRNRLVHQDYATFPLDKTLDEIFKLYKQGLLFVDTLHSALRECDDVCRANHITQIR